MSSLGFERDIFLYKRTENTIELFFIIGINFFDIDYVFLTEITRGTEFIRSKLIVVKNHSI